MSTPPVREQFLVISALGANSMELTNVLCRVSQENRCAVISTRLSRHGEYSALVLQIAGSWDALARLGNQSSRTGQETWVYHQRNPQRRSGAPPPGTCHMLPMSARFIARTSSMSCASSLLTIKWSWKTSPATLIWLRRQAAPCSTQR